MARRSGSCQQNHQVSTFQFEGGGGSAGGGGLLRLGDHDGLQQLVQLVLDQVRQLAHQALVSLDHVQVQLELFGDGGVGRLVVLRVLTGMTGGERREEIS